MANGRERTAQSIYGVTTWLAAITLIACFASELTAGAVARNSSVGGVSVDPEGLLQHPEIGASQRLRAIRKEALEQVPADLTPLAKLRKVSLRGLEEAISRHRSTKFVPLPDAIQYLAGLQRIQYIVVFPEEHDIVLAGPAEGWRVDESGNVVGLTTGQPVLELDDLLVALRTTSQVGQQVISCSIDPTPQGLQNLRDVAKTLQTIGNPEQTMSRIEEALGPQVVSVSGVPDTSHFARVMVAADFRMKRLAMNFEPAPVAGLPSYLHMLKAGPRGMTDMIPRWWLAPKAEPLLTDPEGLTWEIRGLGVQCLTEEDFVNQAGGREGTGKASAVAKNWADTFTARYEDLAKKDIVFGQLRNLMDLVVVSALIHKQNLLDQAGFGIPHLTAEEPIESFNAPKRVASRVSFLKKGRNWLISASGGVQMFPAEMVDKSEPSQDLAPVRAESARKDQSWWWN